MEFREDLQRYLQAMDISLQEEIIQGLCRYQGLLYAANDHTNLTSIEERDSALLNFADSLSALKDIPAHGTLLDMGTGAGLPGLALAIARPDLQLSLIHI